MRVYQFRHLGIGISGSRGTVLVGPGVVNLEAFAFKDLRLIPVSPNMRLSRLGENMILVARIEGGLHGQPLVVVSSGCANGAH